MHIQAPACSSVALVPWDPTSPEHVDRLIEQRKDCGWHADKPAGPWQKAQQEGIKCIYWIVLPEHDASAEEKIKVHAQAHPKQSTPLLDTCTALRGLPLEPTKEEFIPVGHIALDVSYHDADQFNMDIPTDSVIWIKSLFISLALQSSGLGRAAMDTLEAMATSEPLSATTLMLDTMQKDDQIRLKNPKMSNEEWYERRGYRTIHTVPGFYDMNEVPEAKNLKDFVPRTVFMRMDLA